MSGRKAHCAVHRKCFSFFTDAQHQRHDLLWHFLADSVQKPVGIKSKRVRMYLRPNYRAGREKTMHDPVSRVLPGDPSGFWGSLNALGWRRILTFTVGSDAYLNLISADPPLPYKREVMLRIFFSTFSSIFSCFVIHDHWSETGFRHFLRDIYYLSYLTDENCCWTNTTLSHGRFLWRPLPKVAVYRSEHPETSHLCAARPSVHLCHSQGQSLTLYVPSCHCQVSDFPTLRPVPEFTPFCHILRRRFARKRTTQRSCRVSSPVSPPKF